MIEIQDLSSDFNKLKYYIAHSSGGFVVWECNEYAIKNIIEKEIRQYRYVTVIDISKYTRSEYLGLIRKRDGASRRKKIFMMYNFAESSIYDDCFNINSLLMELNFIRDVLAQYDNIYIFVLPTYVVEQVMIKSPSFWSYVSVHFRVGNMVYCPLKLKLFNATDMQYVENPQLKELCRSINHKIILLRRNFDIQVNKDIYAAMEKIYAMASGIVCQELLWKITYNMSRSAGWNHDYHDAFHYARKCRGMGCSLKKNNLAKLNYLYCNMGMGFHKIKRTLEGIDCREGRELYYIAVENFAYGNITLAKAITERYLNTVQNTNKYFFLFKELLATILFVTQKYELALRLYTEVLFELPYRFKDSYVDTKMIERNMIIVRKALQQHI